MKRVWRFTFALLTTLSLLLSLLFFSAFVRSYYRGDLITFANRPFSGPYNNWSSNDAPGVVGRGEITVGNGIVVLTAMQQRLFDVDAKLSLIPTRENFAYSRVQQIDDLYQLRRRWPIQTSAILGIGWSDSTRRGKGMGTLRHSQLSVPLLWPTAIFAGVASAALPGLVRVYRAGQRRKCGLCPICGYDLRLETPRCPECGAERQYNPRPALIARQRMALRIASMIVWLAISLLSWLATSYALLTWKLRHDARNSSATSWSITDQAFDGWSAGVAILFFLITGTLAIRGKLPGTRHQLGKN